MSTNDSSQGNDIQASDITDKQARQAVQTLLQWIGEDPQREGLQETPRRFLDAWKEYFAGYAQDPHVHLKTTFAEYGQYHGQVIVRNLEFMSHCEHHLAPIKGTICVAYVPRDKVVGLSKIARVCQIYAKRLQLQEKLTNEIAVSIMQALEPAGVAVHIRASHGCMNDRGIKAHAAITETQCFLGDYKASDQLRQEFTAAVRG